MPPGPPDLLTGLLKQVSRSFYLTLRVLPGAVRPQISLAYLLARATDTIADTGIVPVAQRLSALQALREAILNLQPASSAHWPSRFGELARHQGLPAERALLERMEEALACLKGFPPADQQTIREVLAIITSGQELDLQRFGAASEQQIVALETEADLDDYTFRVAGCVGQFWTQMCRAHVFPQARLDSDVLLAQGVRFGKGLQLVNILRDLPADLRKGRCYIPRMSLQAAGLVPGGLLMAENSPRFQPVYAGLLDLAASHLAAGWAYTLSIPWRCLRVRLACAWPVLVGIRTLEKLRSANILDAAQRIKASRAEVRNILLRSLVLYPWPAAWQRMAPAAPRPPAWPESG